MAKKKKKDFKNGLSNIIEESLNLFSSTPEQTNSEELEKLKRRIYLLERELYLWRTGKLNLETFHKTLAEHGLKYNPTTNQIEKAS